VIILPVSRQMHFNFNMDVREDGEGGAFLIVLAHMTTGLVEESLYGKFYPGIFVHHGLTLSSTPCFHLPCYSFLIFCTDYMHFLRPLLFVVNL
jgi:hypothetical protein